MHILIVDNDFLSMKVARQLLSRWNVKVTAVNSGEQALDLLEGNNFNLVMLDFMLPGITGFELAEKIRTMPGGYFSTVPLIAYTASSSINTKEKVESCGMTDFLSKPLIPEELHRLLNLYLYGPYIEPRPLRIRFDLYAENNSEFKAELITLMTNNLRELQQASYKSHYSRDGRTFFNAAHKIKSTLLLLNDSHFLHEIDEVKSAFQNDADAELLKRRIVSLNIFTESIIKTLEVEKQSLNAIC